MSSQDEKKPDETKKQNRPRGTWRPVDPQVWTEHAPPPKGLKKAFTLLERIGSLLIHPLALPFLALAGVAGFISTFALAYYIGGTTFFGPVLLGIWSLAIALGILVLEKSGYSRNFESWDFPFPKMLWGIPGFLLALGFMWFLLHLP